MVLCKNLDLILQSFLLILLGNIHSLYYLQFSMFPLKIQNEVGIFIVRPLSKLSNSSSKFLNRIILAQSLVSRLIKHEIIGAFLKPAMVVAVTNALGKFKG